MAPHVNFAIQPAGRGAPKIDPKPILDGWKLLEATAIYRAAGKDPFEGSGATIGQILLMSKEQLERRVLADPALEIYECGRNDIQHRPDRPAAHARCSSTWPQRGFRLTITSLKCGHSVYTSSGNISQHSIGSAVDIAAINGHAGARQPGPRHDHRGAGPRRARSSRARWSPSQVISLMDFGGPTFAMADHADHVHVGYTPATAPDRPGTSSSVQMLKPEQWKRLIDRIAEIDNPEVPTVAVASTRCPGSDKGERKDKGRRASGAHVGE